MQLRRAREKERAYMSDEKNEKKNRERREASEGGRRERGGRGGRGRGDRRQNRRRGVPRRERTRKEPPLEENVPLPEAFQALGLSEQVLKAVHDLGYEKPSPVQEQAIPFVLEGRDLLAAAQTGTGKTAAFLLPGMDRLGHVGAGEGPLMLVVTPTRELAQQIDAASHTIARRTGHRTLTVVGGLSYNPQKNALKRGVDVLVATPGRLVDLINQGAAHLDQVQVLVLDEADRMLDMGFLPDMLKIVGQITGPRQTLLFSATLDDKAIGQVKGLVSDPARVEIVPEHTAAETVEQFVLPVDAEAKNDVLTALLKREGTDHVIVFCRTKRRADSCCKRLERAGISAEPIHGDRSQAQRQVALKKFREGRVDVLVATDVLARGIDVTDVRYVVNFDLPEEEVDYIHRIGRTGRAGETGWALTIVTNEDVRAFYAIEGMMEKTAEIYDPGDIECGEHRPFIDPERTPGERGQGSGRTRSRSRRRQRPGKRDRERMRAARTEGRKRSEDAAGASGEKRAEDARSGERRCKRGEAEKRARAVAAAWDAMTGEKRGAMLESGEVVEAAAPKKAGREGARAERAERAERKRDKSAEGAGNQGASEAAGPRNRRERRAARFGDEGGRRRPGDHGRADARSYHRGWEESDRDDFEDDRRGRRANRGFGGRGGRDDHRDRAGRGGRDERRGEGGSRRSRDGFRSREDRSERAGRRFDRAGDAERGARGGRVDRRDRGGFEDRAFQRGGNRPQRDRGAERSFGRGGAQGGRDNRDARFSHAGEKRNHNRFSGGHFSAGNAGRGGRGPARGSRGAERRDRR